MPSRSRISRPCYDKPHRCPGWAGGGALGAKVDRCRSGYVRTRPRRIPERTLSDGYVLEGYDTDHPGSNRFRFGRCNRCGVVTWPYAVRWTSPRYVLGWKLWSWIKEWTLHRYEDGIWDLGPYRDNYDRAFGLWRWYLTKDYHERERWVVGRIVIKEAPDVDYYVMWSSIVDAPICTGNREEMLAELRTDYRRRYDSDDRGSPENQLARCDELGTSSYFKVEGYELAGSWEDSGFVYHGRAWITRANVFVACRRMDEDGHEIGIEDLLENVDVNDS